MKFVFVWQDWDQVSAYSGRSIPRPRIYPMENQGIADDLRSHVSHFSGVVGKMNKQRYSRHLFLKIQFFNFFIFVLVVDLLLMDNHSTVFQTIHTEDIWEQHFLVI